MIIFKTREQIELMRESAQLVSRTLGMLASEVKEGVTPLQLDQMAETYIRDHKGKPGFKGMYGYKYTLCTSVNNEVVHGIPNNRPLQNGDIISVDCGAVLNGYFGDHAYTFAVGEIAPEVAKLLQVTLECLEIGIKETRVGNRIGDIGFVIQQHAEKHGYGVVRELCGHGLGRKLHEDPEVPNYGKRGTGKKIQEGLTIAIEPMINMGKKDIDRLSDEWTIVTKDGLPAAHYEHDVAVINGEPVVLSTFDYIYEAIGRPSFDKIFT